MHLDLQNIQEINLFKDLSPEELDKILPTIRPVKIIEGEQLIREGDTSQIFYVIISGNYMIHFKDGRAFTLHSKGDIIGWSTITTAFTYQESAVAPSVGEALTIPLDEFLQLMQGDSDLGNKITKKVAEFVRQRRAFIKGTPLDKA